MYMDKILMFTGTFIFAIGAYLKYEHDYKHAYKITPKVAKRLIKCGAKVVDIRTKTEFDLGTVTRKNDNNEEKNIAINIPGSKITKDKLENNDINIDDDIIMFCNSGTRAREAADKMVKLKYKNVFYIVETYKSLQI